MPLRHFCNPCWSVPCTMATQNLKRVLTPDKHGVRTIIYNKYAVTFLLQQIPVPDFRLIETVQLELDACIGLGAAVLKVGNRVLEAIAQRIALMTILVSTLRSRAKVHILDQQCGSFHPSGRWTCKCHATACWLRIKLLHNGDCGRSTEII